jgi:hypothetical protein
MAELQLPKLIARVRFPSLALRTLRTALSVLTETDTFSFMVRLVAQSHRQS